MADMSAMEYKALVGDEGSKDGFGGSFLWVILIFLFFLGFSGNGIGGGNNANNLAQVERDVLTTGCGTQKEVLENRYANALQFANLSAQNAQCCCETKVAIHTEGEATRALIQSNYIDSLRTELSDAKTTLSNANQSQYILGQMGKFYPFAGFNPCNGCGNV